MQGVLCGGSRKRRTRRCPTSTIISAAKEDLFGYLVGDFYVEVQTLFAELVRAGDGISVAEIGAGGIVTPLVGNPFAAR